MSTCCKSAQNPRVILADDRPTHPDLSEDGISSVRNFRSIPASPLGDVRRLISDLGHRQEELFGKLMQERKEMQKQLLTMHSDWRAGTEIHTGWQRFQQNVADRLGEIQNQLESIQTASKASSEEQAGWQRFLAAIPESGKKAQAPMKHGPIAPISTEAHHPRPQAISPAASRDSNPNPEILQINRKWSVGLTSAIEPNDASIRSRINNILSCVEFEIGIAFAIIMSGFVMCWESQYLGLEVGYNLRFPARELRANVVWPGASMTFTILDWFFGILFLLEAFAKLCSWRSKYFYDVEQIMTRSAAPNGKANCCGCLRSVQGWNLLDLCCVAVFLIDKVSTISSLNPQMLRLLRLFRMLRLTRLLPVLETLDHLYVMTTAVSGLGTVLMWAILFLSIMLLVCNLFFVQILQATYFNRVTASDLTDEGLHRHHLMYEYFGTCSRCMLSMLEITLGNWPPVARLLSEEVSEWFTLVCMIHKLTIGFAVIGVITGIILQETFKVAQTDDVIMYRQKRTATRILYKKMRLLFDTLDTERNGMLSKKEFEVIGDIPEIKTWLASLDIETDDLPTLFTLIDIDGSGYITFEELVARVPRIKGAARGIDMLAIMKHLRVSAGPIIRRPTLYFE